MVCYFLKLKWSCLMMLARFVSVVAVPDVPTFRRPIGLLV